MCVITNPKDNSIIFIENRHENMYIINLNNMSNLSQCLMENKIKNDEINWLWHRRLVGPKDKPRGGDVSFSVF